MKNENIKLTTLDEKLKKTKLIPHKDFNSGLIDPDLLNSEHENIKEEITCLFCCNIVRNPVQCSIKKCSKMFCLECIQPLINKKNVCPNRCDDKKPIEVEEIPRNMKNVLNCCKIKCLNYNEDNKGCQEILTIENFERHHKEVCQFSQRECQCKKILENEEEIKKHLDVCDLYTSMRHHCSKLMDNGALILHVDNCAKKLKCEKCNNFFIQTELVEHLKNCDDTEIQCSFCRTIFYKREEHLHTKEACFKETSKYNKLYKED